MKIAIGLGSIGAVMLLVYGGFIYITGQTFSSKSDGKDYVIRALGALAILFSSFILFNQLNPELLKVRFDPLSPNITVQHDLSSLMFGSDDRKEENEFRALGYRPVCSNDQQDCENKKQEFLNENSAKISKNELDVKGCFFHEIAVAYDQNCFYYINKEVLTQNVAEAEGTQSE